MLTYLLAYLLTYLLTCLPAYICIYNELTVFPPGAGADNVFYLIDDTPIGSRLLCEHLHAIFTPVADLHSVVFDNFSSISCANYQCWGVRTNGSSVFLSINQSIPCSEYMSANQLRVHDEDLTFRTIDTDKSGMTAAIEKWSDDTYVRFGVTNNSLEGRIWTNLPGFTFKDIAVGKDGIYGLDMNGNFLYFGK